MNTVIKNLCSNINPPLISYSRGRTRRSSKSKDQSREGISSAWLWLMSGVFIGILGVVGCYVLMSNPGLIFDTSTSKSNRVSKYNPASHPPAGQPIENPILNPVQPQHAEVQNSHTQNRHRAHVAEQPRQHLQTMQAQPTQQVQPIQQPQMQPQPQVQQPQIQQSQMQVQHPQMQQPQMQAQAEKSPTHKPVKTANPKQSAQRFEFYQLLPGMEVTIPDGPVANPASNQAKALAVATASPKKPATNELTTVPATAVTTNANPAPSKSPAMINPEGFKIPIQANGQAHKGTPQPTKQPETKKAVPPTALAAQEALPPALVIAENPMADIQMAQSAIQNPNSIQTAHTAKVAAKPIKANLKEQQKPKNKTALKPTLASKKTPTQVKASAPTTPKPTIPAVAINSDPTALPVPAPKNVAPQTTLGLAPVTCIAPASISSASGKPIKLAEVQRKMAAAQYVIQVGAYRESTTADQLKARLSAQGIAARIQKVAAEDGTWFRVSCGPFPSESMALNQKKRLEKQQINGILILQR